MQPDHTPARRELLREFWACLPDAYRGSALLAADPSFRQLLRSFLRNPSDQDARRQLIERLLPIARCAALRAFVRWHRKPDATIDDAVQEATIGMMSAIDVAPDRLGRNVNADRFVGYCYRSADRVIRPGISRGIFGAGVDPKRMILARLRAQFAREHGRLPTREEAADALRNIVPNLDAPSRVPSRSMLPLTDEMEAAGGEDIARPLVDAEVMRLARKGLDRDQWRVLRSVLRGDSLAAIARMLGVSKTAAGNRVNAVLWQARKRADLAAYFGVEPAEQPARHKGRALPSIHSVAPARLVG